MKLELDDADRKDAIKRVDWEPQRKKDGYICIGGIGGHGECYGHGPGPNCLYCITQVGHEAIDNA